MFDLALQIGEPDPFKLAAGISSVTFNYWVAYSRLSPFGSDRDNMHAGIVASTIANVHRKRGSKSLKPTDFMIIDSETAKQQKQQEFINFLDAVAVPKGEK